MKFVKSVALIVLGAGVFAVFQSETVEASIKWGKTAAGTQVECIEDPELGGYYVLIHRGNKRDFELFPMLVPVCTVPGALGGETYEPPGPVEWPYPVGEE